MLSDIEIAQACEMLPITEVADRLGIEKKYLEQYGRYKAKVDLSLLDERPVRDGKLILVTAITPTPAGEGKTTTAIGLADGLRRIGKNAVIAMREPSLGPVFGIKGEIKVQPWCDGPEFLCGFDTLYYKSGTPVEIERSRVAKNIVVMKVKGVDTVEEAQKLRNRVLYIDRDDVELDEGCYFVQDLIGLEVVDADSGESYGKITDVSQTGANDVYHIADEKGNVKLIPAIPEVVAETDIESGVMKITPLEGLFD